MTEKVSIQAIDKTSVHRICSGQVILNLATAVKELVENSLDAGATSVGRFPLRPQFFLHMKDINCLVLGTINTDIGVAHQEMFEQKEVRIKEHGKESIEVVDNGRGVEEANYPGLALKHHTSKLREFVDLTVVDTFGFRGEALSSLCALGEVTITTRHGNATTGHRIDFNHLGTIVKKVPCPRQPGTSVLIHSLFSTLPVRHKEFIRNVKKEFAKMVQVLTAYCLVSTGVKLQCYHISDRGKKSMVLNTNCNASVRDNIINVFGPKQIDSLCEFVQSVPSQDACDELGTKCPEDVPFQGTLLIGTPKQATHEADKLKKMT